jgi:hypothetical protein
MRVQERQKDKAPRISKHLETELVNCQVMNDLIFGKKKVISLQHCFVVCTIPSFIGKLLPKTGEVKNQKNSKMK